MPGWKTRFSPNPPWRARAMPPAIAVLSAATIAILRGRVAKLAAAGRISGFCIKPSESDAGPGKENAALRQQPVGRIRLAAEAPHSGIDSQLVRLPAHRGRQAVAAVIERAQRIEGARPPAAVRIGPRYVRERGAAREARLLEHACRSGERAGHRGGGNAGQGGEGVALPRLAGEPLPVLGARRGSIPPGLAEERPAAPGRPGEARKSFEGMIYGFCF